MKSMSYAAIALAGVLAQSALRQPAAHARPRRPRARAAAELHELSLGERVRSWDRRCMTSPRNMRPRRRRQLPDPQDHRRQHGRLGPGADAREHATHARSGRLLASWILTLK